MLPITTEQLEKTEINRGGAEQWEHRTLKVGRMQKVTVKHGPARGGRS